MRISSSSWICKNPAMEKETYQKTINGHQFVIIKIDPKWAAIHTSKGESATISERMAETLMTIAVIIPCRS